MVFSAFSRLMRVQNVQKSAPRIGSPQALDDWVVRPSV